MFALQRMLWYTCGILPCCPTHFRIRPSSCAGDYNLQLLDELLKEERLTWVGTCNELNAGYAADGYARVRGVAACVVTFTVGGLSIINAIAGSYSEDLPVICITGTLTFGPHLHDTFEGPADL